MNRIVPTFNAGSSSLKFAAFGVDDGQATHIAAGQVEGIGAEPKGSARRAAGERAELTFDPAPGRVDHEAAMGAILGWLEKVGFASGTVAVGHRVVHETPAAPLEAVAPIEPAAVVEPAASAKPKGRDRAKRGAE